jgi:hypothetical protein
MFGYPPAGRLKLPGRGRCSGLVDGVQENLAVERFKQIGGRAGGLAVGAGLRFIVPRDDHDRHLQAAAAQLVLDVQAVHAGHVKIEDDAIWNMRGQRVEELPPRCECFRIQVRCSKQSPESFPHRFVIIDDGDAEPRSLHTPLIAA